MPNPEPKETWDIFAINLKNLEALLRKSKVRLVRSKKEKEAAKQVVQLYFRSLRNELCELFLDTSAIDSDLQKLLGLANQASMRTTYFSLLRAISKKMADLEIQREYKIGEQLGGGVDNLILSDTEKAIIKTLGEIDPDLSLSYEQALMDISSLDRISYHGTANELREILRKVLDKFAPDEAVERFSGFKYEPGLKKPSMRQKAKFILTSRKMTSAQIKSSEESIRVIESQTDAISSLARLTYQAGSSATHEKAAKDSIIRLKRYVKDMLTYYFVTY